MSSGLTANAMSAAAPSICENNLCLNIFVPPISEIGRVQPSVQCESKAGWYSKLSRGSERNVKPERNRAAMKNGGRIFEAGATLCS